MSILKRVLNKKKMCIIAEKYSVALEYSKAFNCSKKDNYFEGKNEVIVWTDGHICTLYDPEDYDPKYKKWNMEDLPIDPNGLWVKIRKGKEYKYKKIKEIIERDDIDSVCIATDSAREGNLIGEYLLKMVNTEKPIYRAMVATTEQKDIIKGFNDLKLDSYYSNMTKAAEARDEIDWLIGCNLSRAYSLVNKERYYVGRCKTVILNMLCKREEKILDTEQKIYYSISGKFDGESGEFIGILDKDIYEKKEADEFLNLRNKQGTIENITVVRKTEVPGLLLNLNELIIAASRRFGYAAEDVYDISQKLYEEHKLITYARTDSRYVKASMKDSLKNIALAIKKFLGIEGELNYKLFEKRCIKDEAVTEHPAITPIFYAEDKLREKYRNLTQKEKNIYDLISRTFINNFFEDHVYDCYKIETNLQGYKFISNKNRIINYGFKKKGISEEFLYKQGDKVICEDIDVSKKLTKLPGRYTDASLFEILGNPSRFVKDKEHKEILKNQGIGTDATRALIVKDLLSNGYAVREEQYIYPSIEGQMLIKNIKTNKLLEPYFTADIEKHLQLIEAGKEDKDFVVKKVRNFIADHVEELKKYLDPGDQKNVKVYGKCPKCGGNIVDAGTKGYGCTNLKTTGCRFFVSKNILGAELDSLQLKKLLNERSTDILKFKGKKGEFKAKIILNKNSETEFFYDNKKG